MELTKENNNTKGVSQKNKIDEKDSFDKVLKDKINYSKEDTGNESYKKVLEKQADNYLEPNKKVDESKDLKGEQVILEEENIIATEDSNLKEIDLGYNEKEELLLKTDNYLTQLQNTNTNTNKINEDSINNKEVEVEVELENLTYEINDYIPKVNKKVNLDKTEDIKENIEDLEVEDITSLIYSILQDINEVKTYEKVNLNDFTTNKEKENISLEIPFDKKEKENIFLEIPFDKKELENIESILNNLIVTLKDEGLNESLNLNPINNLLQTLKTEMNQSSTQDKNIIENSDLSELYINEIFNDIEIVDKNIEAKPKVKSSLDNILNDIKLVLKDIESANEPKNIETIDTETDVLSKRSNEDTSQSFNSNDGLSESIKKEEKVLKSILSDDESSSINKLNLFANSFKEIKNIESAKPVPVASEANFTKDVIKSVKYMQTNGLKELVVKMNPKELGEIAIKIIQEEGILKASIKAQSKETYSLLSQNLQSLQKELENKEIKIQNIDISLNEDSTFFKGHEFENNSTNNEEWSFRNNSKKKESIDNLEEDISSNNTQYEDLSNINMLA